MKSVHDLLRQKELELQQALESAVRAKELELVRLRNILQEALSTIDRLLEEETHSAGKNQMDSLKPLVGAREPEGSVKSASSGGSEFP